MPQIFQVLRCYKCSVFQVHQTKKSNKFQCKLCGEKQSIKRHYALGTAKDCRLHVQKLNSIRGEIENNSEQDLSNEEHSEEEDETKNSNMEQVTKESKWSNYIDNTDVKQEVDDAEMSLNDVKVVLEIPQKRKKPNTCYNNKKSKPNYYNKYSKIKQNDVEDDEASLDINTDHSKPELNSITELNVRLNEIPSVPKKFVPPVINKNSKWAQFADEEEEVNKENCSNNIEEEEDKENTASNGFTENDENLKIEQSQNNLFSQCDDSELDDLLDI